MSITDTPRGSFSRAQTEQLLRGISPSRVITGAHVKPHLSQQDVLAHLSRVFGFGHFDVEVMHEELLYEEQTTNSKQAAAWSVAYRARVRLTVRDEAQRPVAVLEGGSTGESEGQPSRAASHDLAYKSALSTATKRAAIALGDQFGLSLYNKGQQAPLVLGTMVDGPRRDDDDLQTGVEQQHADGGRESEFEDGPAEAEPAAPSAEPAPRKRATRGTQGTRRKAPEPVDEPEATPAPEPAPEPEQAPEPAPAEEVPPHGDTPDEVPAEQALPEFNPKTGEVNQSDAEGWGPAAEAEPETDFDLLVREQPTYYIGQLRAATTEAQVRSVWDRMEAANAATSDLKRETVKHRDRVREGRAWKLADEQPAPAADDDRPMALGG
jgi:hypothetical protein